MIVQLGPVLILVTDTTVGYACWLVVAVIVAVFLAWLARWFA